MTSDSEALRVDGSDRFSFTSPHFSVLGLHGISIPLYDLADIRKSTAEITFRHVTYNLNEYGRGHFQNASRLEYLLEKVGYLVAGFRSTLLRKQIRYREACDSLNVLRLSCPILSNSVRQTWKMIHTA